MAIERVWVFCEVPNRSRGEHLRFANLVRELQVTDVALMLNDAAASYFSIAGQPEDLARAERERDASRARLGL